MAGSAFSNPQSAIRNPQSFRARPLVFLDLETTGLDETREEIIEFAALRVVGGEVRGEFSKLANPGRPLPLAIARLTGIADAELRRQPPSRSVLAEFLSFVGDDVMVAHNARFDRAFLVQKSDQYFQNPAIDTLELARILYPTFEHHDLDTLCQQLELHAESRHRALDDVRLLVQLWDRLLQRLEELPFEVVRALSSVASLTAWPARELFREAESSRMTSVGDLDRVQYRRLLPDHSDLLDAARKERQGADPAKRPAPKRLDVAQLTGLFGESGLFAQKIPGYEVRPQQARMVQLVAEAYNEGQHLLVEAGTGVGKSMAYLVPAISWSQTNGEKIVISTNTKNLQEQLFLKDIPLLAQTLGVEFTTALIKGRANYLCVRKLLYLLEEGELELAEEERLAFLAILVWAAETEVGDVAENTGFLAFRQRDLWPKLCASAEECPGPACKERRHCFLNRARALSMLSDLVVANHAVVFAELGMDSAVLPQYGHLVFDEAHNIEDVATEYLGCDIDRFGVTRLTHRLVRRDRSGPERGLLPSIRYRMKKGRETALIEAEEALDQLILYTYGNVSEVEDRVGSFLRTVGEAFEATHKGNSSLRYDAAHRNRQYWEPVEEEKAGLVAAIGQLCKQLDRIGEKLGELEERDFNYRTESIYDVKGLGESFQEIEQNLEFLVAANDPSFVYWIERFGRKEPLYRIAAAPIRIGPKIKELLYDRKDTIIFTSATLSAAGKFDFLKDRIGLDQVDPARLRQEDVGSPFDYRRQMLVLVPNFIEEPDRDEAGYAASVSKLLIEIFRASSGRGLGLFTSYAMLNEAYPKLKAALEAERILVLGQGIDGERRAITRTFQRDVSSVLLGTDSFWEGVDVPGESLSCLVIVKLPFAVHTDPVVQARCEDMEARGKNSFVHYTLPGAVIRLKQGVGRLIRMKTDFGVVCVLDRRLLTRRYGEQFLRSLPTGYRTCANVRHMCDMIRAFLTAHPLAKR